MRSLRRKFLLATLLGHLVVALAMLTAMYRLLDHALLAQVEESGARSRELLVAALVPLLIARDLATADELAASLVGEGAFVYVEVRDPAGRRLVSAGAAPPVPAPRPRGLATLFGPVENYHFDAALGVRQQPLGQLHFALEGASVRMAKRSLVGWLVVLGTGGLALAAALQWGLARRLTARLERLAAAAGRVAGGEQGLQLPVRGEDEAARLTESFNRMSTALDQRFAARVEAERALERANEQLEVRVRERTAELEQARNVAEQASRAKSEFLSRMSHELRTPLNAILGFAQLLRLRNGHTSPEVGAQLGHIETAGWHLLELINDVLDLSRIEAGSLAIDVREVAVAPLVAESLRMVQATAAANEVSIHDGTGMLGAVTVQGDPTRLRQVLVNLLSNACKYNRRGGTVTVDARRDDGWLELAVVDTGPGLDAGQIAALFEPFNRLGMERSGVDGTGIGLVITRRLVELMGGGLDVQSRPGLGSRFAVRLRLGGREAA